jgi:predicted PurR-regulated permease PerM
MIKDSDRRLRGMIFSTLTITVIVGTLVYLLWALRPLLLPIILGVLLAYLFRPLKSAFKYRWLPNGIRVILLFTVLTGSILFGVKFIKDNIPTDKEKTEILVRLKYKFNEKFDKMASSGFYKLIAQDVSPIKESLNNYLELSTEQKDLFLEEPVSEKYYQYFLTNNKKDGVFAQQQKTAAKVKPSTDNNEKSFLKIILNILSIWFILPIVFLVFLTDDGTIGQFFIRLVPNRYFELSLNVRDEVDGAIGKYLRGISLECSLVGISMSLGLCIVGVPLKMALLIGILSGVATAIPFLGPVVGLSFGLTFALIAEDIHPLLPFINLENFLLAVLVVNAIVLGLDNVVFQPIVLGSAVNLHPLVVILGIMGASMMFGMAGVLLAIPTIVVIKVVVQHAFRGLKDYRII